MSETQNCAIFIFSAMAETLFLASFFLRPRPKFPFMHISPFRPRPKLPFQLIPIFGRGRTRFSHEMQTSVEAYHRQEGFLAQPSLEMKASIRPAFFQLFCPRACSFYDYKQPFELDHRSSEVSGSIIVVSFCPFSHCVSRFLWIIKCQKLLVDLVWPVHNRHLHIIQYRYLGNAEGYCYYAGTEVAFFQCWLYIQLSFYTFYKIFYAKNIIGEI